MPLRGDDEGRLIPWCVPVDDGVTLRIRVVPGARRSEVAGTTGDRLRVRIAAPAVDGKANAEVQRFLAEWCGVRRSAVELVAGERSREKVVRVTGVTDEQIRGAVDA
jgi:uncharacterized protein (TIGR00251 family)